MSTVQIFTLCTAVYRVNLSLLVSGAISSTVYIHSEEISDITYVQDRVRVRVKAIGALSVQDAITATPSSDKTLSDSRTKDGNMDQSVQLDVTQVVYTHFYPTLIF